jgi:hypothetical protein
MSDNELALILKIISQCDVRQWAGSDTENYQSVWCQTMSWLWYWKLSVSVMSDNAVSEPARCLTSHWLIIFSIRASSLSDITLTDNFQCQSQLVDTDHNITGWDQRSIIQIIDEGNSISVMSDNELALILKIISQCDVRQWAGSDTENYQSVWCQTTSWLWYWKLSVSVMSDNELDHTDW